MPTASTLRSTLRHGWRQVRRGLVGARKSGRGAPQTQGPDRRYPGDFTGALTPVYDPHPDARPDPGEVVWAWVPFEEDHRRGKDRPVLLVGRDGEWLLGLPLTSTDHDRDARQEAQAGRDWMDIGSGAWDSRGRASEVRLNRVVRLAPHTIRRDGAVLAPDIFHRVAQAVAQRR